MSVLNEEKVSFLSEGFTLSGVLYQVADSVPRAIIICHGAFEHKGNWLQYAEALAAEGFTTLTFDFIGHGESAGLRSTVNVRTWAYNIHDAMEFLGNRGFSHFALIGWGSGASAAIVAAVHETRVFCTTVLSPIVLLMPPMAERTAFLLATFFSKVKQKIHLSPLTLSRLREYQALSVAKDQKVNNDYLSDPYTLASLKKVPVAEALDSVWIDITGAAKKIRTPILIIHGDKDTINPLEQSKQLIKIVQGNGVLQIIEGSGHALHIDLKRDEVYRRIVKWIKHNLP
jgi:uncharacterized protein